MPREFKSAHTYCAKPSRGVPSSITPTENIESDFPMASFTFGSASLFK